MSNRVTVFFDINIEGVIVKLPHMVTLEELQVANLEFTEILSKIDDGDKFSILLDTGSHEFENIETLKYLRTMLSTEKIFNDCIKFASVAPESFVGNKERTDREAMFSKYENAYNWLKI